MRTFGSHKGIKTNTDTHKHLLVKLRQDAKCGKKIFLFKLTFKNILMKIHKELILKALKTNIPAYR